MRYFWQCVKFTVALAIVGCISIPHEVVTLPTIFNADEATTRTILSGKPQSSMAGKRECRSG